MEFKDVLAARHSVRSFTDQKIERVILDDMIAEALLAPSSRNSKSSGFMVIEDASLLEELSLMRDYGAAPLSGATAGIVVLGDTSKTDLWRENASISATYLLLSAASRGIGGCWIHVDGRPRVKSDPLQGSAEDFVRSLLGIKDNMRPLCIIALGYEAR